MKKTCILAFVIVLSACADKVVNPRGNEQKPSQSMTFFMTKPQATEPVELVFDKKYSGKKPEAYRVNKDLRMSGSAMFGPKALKELAKPAKKNKSAFFVFDLRQESHGLLNDEPVTWHSDREWANADLNHDEALRRERRQLGDLRVGEQVSGVEIKSIETEESMVRSAGYQYVRLTVTDLVRPVDSEVDRFVEAVRALPENAWVHFHCRSGKGRSTLFMMMYDMLINAKSVSYEDIVERNKKLSLDPDVLTIGEEKDWKYPYQKEQAEFMQAFYNYAKAHPLGEKALWSEWLR